MGMVSNQEEYEQSSQPMGKWVLHESTSHSHAGEKYQKKKGGRLEKNWTLAFPREQKTHQAEHSSEREVLFEGMIPPTLAAITYYYSNGRRLVFPGACKSELVGPLEWPGVIDMSTTLSIS